MKNASENGLSPNLLVKFELIKRNLYLQILRSWFIDEFFEPDFIKRMQSLVQQTICYKNVKW